MQLESRMGASGSDRLVRRIVVAGVLSAITMLLGMTIGFVPVATAAGSATFMHIPVIIGGVLEGPVVGAAVGLVFGIACLVSPAVPVKDVLVVVLPRLAIGVVAWAAYFGLRTVLGAIFGLVRSERPTTSAAWGVEAGALAVAGFLGSATNTTLVLTMAVVRGLFEKGPAIAIGLAQGIPEAIVAAVLVPAVVLAIKGIAGGRRHADL